MQRQKIASDRLPIVTKRLSSGAPPAVGQGIRLGVYQGQSQVGNKQATLANLKTLEKACEKAASHGVQLLGLPELFLSGYNLYQSQLPDVAMTQDDPILVQVGGIAARNEVAIVCSFPEKSISNGQVRYPRTLTDKHAQAHGPCRRKR